MLPDALSKKLLTFSRYMGIMCAFGIPWSNGFFNWGFYLMLISFILSLDWQNDFKPILKTSTVFIAVSIFTYIFIRTAFSNAPWDFAKPDLFNYRKLLAIPIFVSLFTTTAQKKRLAVSYCLGVFVLMIPTIIDGFGYSYLTENMPFFKRNAVYSVSLNGAHNFTYWRNHISHGFHVATLFAACTLGSIYFKKYRFPLILIAALCATDILFFIYGRMALLSLFFGITIIALIHLSSKKHIAIFVALLAFSSVSAYIAIPSVKARISSIQSETIKYFSKEDLSVSAGQRLHFWKVSWHLFENAPVLGQGSGFKYYLKISDDPLYKFDYGHTHNEYLTQLSLYGAIGFTLFMTLIIISLRNSRLLEDKWLANFTTTVILIFCFNALTDSSLHNDWEGWTFVIFASIACFNHKIENSPKISGGI